jgi:tetratricopeptide (TPR) repeat protein
VPDHPSVWRRGRQAEALTALEQLQAVIPYNVKIASPFYSQPYERYVRAELANDLGREEEALRWYRSFAEHSIYDVMYQAPSLLRRGQIHERLGEPKEAAWHYTRFIELWQDCDPEFRPLEEAKRQLALL